MPDPCVTVIGAGPVGALLSAMLARRGFDVEVYERRADPRLGRWEGGRSINLAVSTRGLHALHQLGLDQEVLAAAVPMRGRMVHALGRPLSFHAYGSSEAEFINSMSRGGLNELLMTAAEGVQGASGGGRVRIHFQERLVAWEPARRTLTFSTEPGGRTWQAEAGVVIGTDGSASALRAGFAQRGARVSQDLLDFGYKELTLPAAPGDGLGERGRFQLHPNALHLWPRGRLMMIALPNPAGDFTCTLFLPFDAPLPQPSLASLADEQDANEFLHGFFPDLAALIPDAAEALLRAPVGKMVTVRTSPWCEGCALLLGDAAHAIVPFFGQGMNAGFEDCTLLDEALGRAQQAHQREAPLDWPALFSGFSAARKPDADAIADLALENFVEMRDRVADPVFQLHRAVEVALQKRLPGRYLTRYQLVTFSRRPYRVALAAGKVQAALLAEVCQGCERVEQVDLERAVRLAEERLLPMLED